MAELTGAQSRLIDEATAVSAGLASLSDIQRLVDTACAAAVYCPA